MKVLFYIIPGVIGVSALITMLVMYARKFPKLAALDLEAMSVHRQLARKSTLVQERLRRKLDVAKQSLRAFFTPILGVLRQLFRGVLEYVQALEIRYRAAAKATTKNGEQAAPQQDSIVKLLQEAQALSEEEKYPEAEKKYIAAIAIDTRSVDAYRGLATLYVAMNDLPHAIATLQFLEQLDPKDESTYLELGELYKKAGKYEEALDAFEQALALNPNNPKNLDPFIEVAILNGLKYKAQSTLNKLKEVNPENQKLQKYQEEIDQL